MSKIETFTAVVECGQCSETFMFDAWQISDLPVDPHRAAEELCCSGKGGLMTLQVEGLPGDIEPGWETLHAWAQVATTMVLGAPWWAIRGYAETLGIDDPSELERTDPLSYYVGAHDSFEEYAEELVDELYSVPESLWPYIDIDKWAHDLAYDYTIVDAPGKVSGVAIFYNN